MVSFNPKLLTTAKISRITVHVYSCIWINYCIMTDWTDSLHFDIWYMCNEQCLEFTCGCWSHQLHTYSNILLLERMFFLSQEQGIEVQYCVYNCFTPASFPWLITCFLYLALLQFIAVILAIQTRNVKIRILNDSKEVAIIIYFTSFVMIVMLASTFILSDYNNVSDGIFGSSLMVSTSVTLIVVFLPKVIFNLL